MSHSIRNQFIHLLWATKDLAPLIIEDSRISFIPYLSGILKNLGGLLLVGSETSNHIHLLINAPTNLSIAELLNQIKSCSSKWYREENKNKNSNINSIFNWTDGYSAFTVSPSSLDNVEKYLKGESQRHKTRSFQDELTNFLNFHNIHFNPQYLTNTTYTQLIYHLVWSVKNREPYLEAILQAPLHQRIKHEVEKTKSKLHAIGNVADHIHLLIECSSKISTASLVQNIKTATTHLIKTLNGKNSEFCWQEGYGVFSVGKPAFETVLRYVNNQEQHHKDKTFDQEWNGFLEMNSVGPPGLNAWGVYSQASCLSLG